MSEFLVADDYQGYVYVGSAQGRFDAELPGGGTEKRVYYNMYVISPVSSYSSADYAAQGMKAEKLKCINASVWAGLKPGDRVRLFFDDKKRVQMAALDH